MEFLYEPLFVGIVVGLFLGYCAYKLAQSQIIRKRKETKKIWVKVGKLTDILIYQVKSCRGISVEKALCPPFGIECGEKQDRRFMLFDRRQQLAIRTVLAPRAALINADVQNGQLRMSTDVADDTAPVIDIATIVRNGETLDVTLYGQGISGYDCGDEVAAWLTKTVDIDERRRRKQTDDVVDPHRVRLLYHVHGLSNDRGLPNFDRKWCPSVDVLHKDEKYAFQNYSSFMMMSSTSVALLNDWADYEGKQQHSMCQFKPNFVVSDCEPFSEDYWSEIRIGTAQFLNVMPCTRCPSTQICTVTAKKFPNNEPMTSLRKQRPLKETYKAPYYKDRPHMGIHLSLMTHGEVNVGDDVYAVVTPR